MTLTNVTNVGHGDSNLNLFAQSYAGFHGYVSICVCVFGIVTNLFNISGKKCMHRDVRKHTLCYAPNEDSNEPAHLRCQHEKKNCSSFAIQNTPSEDSDQSARMRRLIRIFTWRTCPKERSDQSARMRRLIRIYTAHMSEGTLPDVSVHL